MSGIGYQVSGIGIGETGLAVGAPGGRRDRIGSGGQAISV